MVSKMDRLCNLGKKVCVAGAVLVSLPVAVPIIVPSLFVLSVVGVALSIPVGSAAVGFVVVKKFLGLGKQTAGYILAPPACTYENKKEILAENYGTHGVEVTQLYEPKKVRGDSVSEMVEETDFAACDAKSAAPEIEEEALVPASQLYSGDSVSEIVVEEPVKLDLPISRPFEAESEPLSPPTQVYENKKVSGDSHSGYEVVEENSGNPGGDSNKSFAAACGVTAEFAAESEALTSPTQPYETKQFNGHRYSGEIVENDSVKHSDESNKDNAGRDGATESKEAAQATGSTEFLGGIDSHVSEEAVEGKNPDLGDGLRAAENCNVEASPKIDSPKLLTENSLEPLANNSDSVKHEESTGDQAAETKNPDLGDGLTAAGNCNVEASPKHDSPKLLTENPSEPVPDVGALSAEEAPENCWETPHTAVEPVYVKDFEDVDSPRVVWPCKSAPDFYECMEAKEISSVAVTEGNENFEEAKDVDLPPSVAEVSTKLLKPDVVPEPVENVADVSVELAPELWWEIATKATEPERICVEDSEDVDSLKKAFPCKSIPDFYEHMDVKELGSLDDRGEETANGNAQQDSEVKERNAENAQQDSEVKEGNAEEIVEDGVASASGTIGVDRKWEAPLSRVESTGCLEDSARSPITFEGEEQIHFENAGGPTDGQDPTEPGSMAEDEIALASDEETFRGAASEDDQSRSCGPKASFLKPSVSMIPV